MVKTRLRSIILVLVTFILLYLILKDNFNSSIKILSTININWFGLAVILFVAYLLLEGYVTHTLITQYRPKEKFLESFKLIMLTKFFNGITPLSAGGRPLLIFELTRKKIKGADATNVIVQNFIVFQSALTLFSIVIFFLNYYFDIFKMNSLLGIMTIIGFALNSLVLIIAFIFSISKKNNKIINGIIKFLYKIKIVKNKEKQKEIWEQRCKDYYEGFNGFKHNRELILKGIFIEIIAVILYYLIPICIFNSLGGLNDLNIFTCIIAGNFIFLVGSFIPLPGGSGGIEYGFIGFFGGGESTALMASALVLWRFLTYYLPTLVGGVMFNIRKRKKD